MTNGNLLLALAILSSSFWGSWHCAAMCGPIASIAAQQKSLWLYNLGRGVSYVLAGAMGGALGSFFLQSDFVYLRWIAGVLFAISLCWMGWQLLQNKSTGPAWKISKFYSPGRSATLLGMLSIFLPCGWLYTYVLAAVATRSALAGALLMLLFWLGGLPTLSALSQFMKKSISLSNQKKQRIAGGVLIVAGVYSLASFYFAH